MTEPRENDQPPPRTQRPLSKVLKEPERTNTNFCAAVAPRRRLCGADHKTTREHLLLPRDHAIGAEKVPEMMITLRGEFRIHFRSSCSFTPRLLLPVCVLVEITRGVKGNISTLIINFPPRILPRIFALDRKN